MWTQAIRWVFPTIRGGSGRPVPAGRESARTGTQARYASGICRECRGEEVDTLFGTCRDCGSRNIRRLQFAQNPV